MAIDNSDLVFITKRLDNGNITASDAFAQNTIYYRAETKKCADAEENEVKCPNVILQEIGLKSNNLILTVGLIFFIVSTAILLGLYLNKK